MITVDKEMLDYLSTKAQSSARKRSTFNFHHKASDTIHRMLNAMQPGTYISPHKHENPDKREAFWVLRGRIALVIFEENGTIREHIVLDPKAGNYGSELQPRTWHCLICLEKNSVAYEVKDGPWEPSSDKIFAPWAPKEDESGAWEYLQELINTLNLRG